jgi:hypothetical protein
MNAALAAMGVQPLTVNASTIYIDTTGTDFPLGGTGTVTLSVEDSANTVIASQSFTWITSGTHLVFQDVSAVQSWLNEFPSADNVTYSLAVASPPANGVSHSLSAAVVYQGTSQASATLTFVAQCVPKVHTITPCHL